MRDMLTFVFLQTIFARNAAKPGRSRKSPASRRRLQLHLNKEGRQRGTVALQAAPSRRRRGSRRSSSTLVKPLFRLLALLRHPKGKADDKAGRHDERDTEDA